jgi:hypothetical protein
MGFGGTICLTDGITGPRELPGGDDHLEGGPGADLLYGACNADAVFG